MTTESRENLMENKMAKTRIILGGGAIESPLNSLFCQKISVHDENFNQKSSNLFNSLSVITKSIYENINFTNTVKGVRGLKPLTWQGVSGGQLEPHLTFLKAQPVSFSIEIMQRFFVRVERGRRFFFFWFCFLLFCVASPKKKKMNVKNLKKICQNFGMCFLLDMV